MARKAEGPKRDVRIARKDYHCSSPDRTCTRRILRGDPYTQLSYAPYQPPFSKSSGWTILRLCSTCSPIAPSESPVPTPCPFGTGTNQCILTEGHIPAEAHQFAPEALF